MVMSLLFWQESIKKQKCGKNHHFFPRRKSMGPQESVKFAVLKLSCVPDIKIMSHRPGEHRILTETEETRVIDSSVVRAP